jgi:undecaprenyl-diphosphatase
MFNWIKFFKSQTPKTIKLFILFAGSYLFLGFFLKLTFLLIKEHHFEAIDVPILQFIALHFRTPVLTEAMVDITALGSPSIISLLTIIGLVTLVIRKDRASALFLAVNVIGATLWMAILKNAIARERPQVIPRLIEISGNSYPSGHTLVSTATYLSIAFLLCKKIRARSSRIIILSFASFIILEVGFSRLYLGVHYPSDVFSGMLFGVSFVLWLTALFETVTHLKDSNK